jgi:hypothetical protein
VKSGTDPRGGPGPDRKAGAIGGAMALAAHRACCPEHRLKGYGVCLQAGSIAGWHHTGRPQPSPEDREAIRRVARDLARLLPHLFGSPEHVVYGLGCVLDAMGELIEQEGDCPWSLDQVLAALEGEPGNG